MKIIRQGHEDRFTEDFQRINIHWDLILMCNYKCSYCYARNLDYFGQKWLKFPTLEQQMRVVDALSQSHLPFNLGFLGGEPSLYPHFKPLMDYLFDKCSFNETLQVPNRFYLVTNGSKENDWFKNLPKRDNFSVLFSYHPEHCKHEVLLRNIQDILDKGIKAKVNIMLHPSSKLWARTEKFYKECLEIEDLKIHPHFLYKTSDKDLWDYSEEFWTWAKYHFGDFDRDIAFEELREGRSIHHLFNDYEVYKKGINNFKGFQCMNNNYEINIDGSVTIFCKNERHNLLTEQDYFKKVTEIKPMLCNYEQCNCDGLLKLYKYKENP